MYCSPLCVVFGIKVLKTSCCCRQFIFHYAKADKMADFFGYLCGSRRQFDVCNDVMA